MWIIGVIACGLCFWLGYVYGRSQLPKPMHPVPVGKTQSPSLSKDTAAFLSYDGGVQMSD